MAVAPILSIAHMVKTFDISGGYLDQLVWREGRPRLRKTIVRAVNDVSLSVGEGETVSVVGESGCGKSTLARTVMNVYPPDSGEIHFKGERLDGLSPHGLRPYRTRMQMVFQDPYASLNPRMTVRAILEEPVRFHNQGISDGEVKDLVARTMLQVGVDPTWNSRYPHEFSGGQRQRISIARALVVDPEFIVADEPIAALDVSIQAQILNLLMDAQQDRKLTYLFISHDLNVVRHISKRVAVMYLGTLCELSDTETLFDAPRHPYTQALLSAIPRLGRKGFTHVKLKGEVPTPIDLPSGCVFHTRCPHAVEICHREIPPPLDYPNGSTVACHRVADGSI